MLNTRCLSLILLSLISRLGFAQQHTRLEFLPSKDEQSKKFTTACLCNQDADRLIPNYTGLDTVKRIKARIRIDTAITFNKGCDGIYYYILHSGYWKTPTFRGPYYDHSYLAIIHGRLIAFKAGDKANRRKFNSIRPDLVRYMGVRKADSLKPHIISGNIQF